MDVKISILNACQTNLTTERVNHLEIGRAEIYNRVINFRKILFQNYEDITFGTCLVFEDY